MRRSVRTCRGLVLAAVVCAAASCTSKASDLPTGTLRIRAVGQVVEVRVEIADTDGARQRGLMGRTSLDPDSGMAFLFGAPSTGGFWMKDTLIPLDIAFWASGGQIVDILQMVPCRADPCRLYVPARPYVGAVEANAGFFERRGIRPGDLVVLDRTPSL